MKLTIDGYLYQWQRRGGVSRIFSEILPRMCEADPSLLVRLLTEAGPLAQTPPVHERILHRRIPRVEDYLRPRRVWRAIVPRMQQSLRKAYIGNGQAAIWHSTYFTEPQAWQGKQVVTVYDLAHQRFPELFNGVDDEKQRQRMMSCIRKADRIIAISHATSCDVQEYFALNDPSKVRVVHLACGDIFRPLDREEERKTKAEKPFLLYVGDRNHYKNFQFLLRAFAKWPGRDGVELVVVGGRDWSTEETAIIRDLHLSECVRLIEAVDDQDLVRLYHEALAFVYPSLYEGFGIPLLEALSCGCVVVASRIPSTIEVAADCPIYFEPGQPDSLIAALDTALADSNNSGRRAKGLQQAAKFSWDKTAQETLAIYRELDAEMRAA
jgi:glycosyltransferase involved in cell wall biosynthesis